MESHTCVAFAVTRMSEREKLRRGSVHLWAEAEPGNLVNQEDGGTAEAFPFRLLWSQDSSFHPSEEEKNRRIRLSSWFKTKGDGETLNQTLAW